MVRNGAELIPGDPEFALVLACQQLCGEPDPWLVYADWLNENGRHEEAVSQRRTANAFLKSVDIP